jgi:hypothetical protein
MKTALAFVLTIPSVRQGEASEWQGKQSETNLHALLTGLDGGNIASNTTTDDDQVLLLTGGSEASSPSCGVGRGDNRRER